MTDDPKRLAMGLPPAVPGDGVPPLAPAGHTITCANCVNRPPDYVCPDCRDIRQRLAEVQQHGFMWLAETMVSWAEPGDAEISHAEGDTLLITALFYLMPGHPEQAAIERMVDAWRRMCKWYA